MITSDFCTSITPMPKSGRHPHRPLTSFGATLVGHLQESWAEWRAVLAMILPFKELDPE